jgi:hypothetical protein
MLPPTIAERIEAALKTPGSKGVNEREALRRYWRYEKDIDLDVALSLLSSYETARAKEPHQL